MSAVFEGLIVTLREGVEAALLIALMLAALTRAGERGLRHAVFAGLVAALVVSVGSAVAFRFVAVNQELLEGALYLAAAAMVTSMLLWLHRNVRSLRGDLDCRIVRLKERGAVALWWGLFLFCFISVLREGVETVLFLGALSFDSGGLGTLIGAGIGLSIAVVFAVCFVRGSMRIDLLRFFRVTSILLGILILQLVVHGFHELAEAGAIPSGPTAMAIVGPIVRHNAIFMAAVLLVPVLLLLIPGRPRSAETVDRRDESAAQRRMGLASQRRAAWARAAAVVSGVLIATVLGADTLLASRSKALSPASEVRLDGSGVLVPVRDLRRKELRRYAVTLAGKRVRFLLYRQPGGQIASAFDACRMCGDRGYVQEGSSVICLNCSAEINAATLGQGGGCNPIPLRSRPDGDAVFISGADLTAGAGSFR